MNYTENHYTETDLGNIAPNPRGDYDNTASYEYLDLVVFEGGSYLCLTELGTTIKGISPESGKTTEHWQVLTLPGDLTPEYVAMHDNVVNKEKEAKASAEAAEASENAAKTSESAAKASENAAKKSEHEAENSKDSSAGYAKTAEESKNAAQLSESNVRNLVDGFDTHVEEKTEESINNIEEARQDAVQVVQNATGTAVNAASAAEESKNAAHLSETNAKASEDAAKASETASKTSETNAKASEEAAANTLEEVIAEGNRIFESLPDDYEEASRNAREAVRTKADAIVCKKSGKTIVATDSSGNYVRGLTPFGKTKQRTTTGAQLANLPDIEETEQYGIKWKCQNGVVTVQGTATALASSKSIGLSHDLTGKSGTYFVSGTVGSTRVYVRIKRSDDSILYPYDSVFTLDGTEKEVEIYLQINQGATVNNSLYPMLNAGSEALPWEPYTGGKPSPSMEYPQELENVGEWGNLLQLPDLTVKVGGVTATVSNGIIKVFGTASQISTLPLKGAYNSTEDICNLKAGKYYCSNGIIIQILRANGKYNYVGNDQSFTLDEGDKIVYVYLQYDSGVTVDETIYPMLNYGTTALPYRPYSGQREIESAVYGGNLLDTLDAPAEVSNVVINDDKSITVTNNAEGDISGCSKVLTGALKAGKYTFTNISGTTYAYVMFVSGDYSHQIPVGGSYTFDYDGTSFLKIMYTNILAGTTKTFKAMLNKGTTALPYEPYTRQSHINLLGSNGLPGIPLGQTIPDVIANSPIHMSGVYWDEETEQYWIGDTVDNESGERVDRCKTKIYNGTEQWTKEMVSSGNAVYFNNAYDALKLVNSRCYSTHYIGSEANYTLLEDKRIALYRDHGNRYPNENWIYIRNDDFSGVDDIKSHHAEQYAKGTPVTVQYILAEPYTVPLTTSEIESYEALHSNHHVTTVMNDCDAHMEFEYNADTQEHIKQNYVPVTSYTALEERVAAIEEQILSQEV